MQCPYCGFQDTTVIDSRFSEEKNAVRRRRECLECGQRSTTYEHPEPVRPIVIKRDGSREPFDRTKLQQGLAKACAKRTVLEEKIEYMVDEIEAELRGQQRTVSSRRLGDMSLVRLRQMDMVSCLRFASVFRQYEDVEQFRSELVKLEGAASKVRS